MNERERLGSRLGFILLSAGCAIGCGNVWKFPWMCGQYGGGAFVALYLLFLVVLGLPVMTMEFAVGRASQKSAVGMYPVLEPKGSKWHIHGYFALAGIVILMMFYTVVTGWMMYYFVKFLTGQNAGLGFVPMITNGGVQVGYMVVAVVIGFLVLSFNLQGGLERVTKYMMVVLLGLMIMLGIHSLTLEGAGEGLRFYLLPDMNKITGEVVVGAMNQAFFTLSLGIGSMAIFGSYVDKKRSLMGESLNVIILDTFVALMSGLIIFPACASFNVDPGSGPSLLFDTMSSVFNHMNGGRWWGTLFFLFMVFAALSTELGVFEAILACVREMTGWDRKKASTICCAAMIVLSLPCALGWSALSGINLGVFSDFQALEDFTVSNCLLPLGSLTFVLFCTWKKGWGWDNMVAEANAGKGLKVKTWMRGYITWVLPVIIAALFVIGIIEFFG